MNISTTRFGRLEIDEADVLTFVDGLIGMEECRRWVLLGDAQNDALGWLQSLDRAEVAVAVVSPRPFVPGYQVRVARRDIQPLGIRDSKDAQVLVIISYANGALGLNLKAPLVVHLEARLGRQVVARDDHPVQYVVHRAASRKSA
jgi:flagellar assembly factor FliW